MMLSRTVSCKAEKGVTRPVHKRDDLPLAKYMKKSLYSNQKADEISYSMNMAPKLTFLMDT